MRAIFSLTIACLMTTSQAFAQQPSAADTTQSFYQWYLTQQEKNIDVFTDQQLKHYVSHQLFRDLSKKHAQGSLDYDYFTNSQDYGDTWKTSIKIEKKSENSNTAIILVTLGKAPDLMQNLTVHLKKEQGAWKINQVTKK